MDLTDSDGINTTGNIALVHQTLLTFRKMASDTVENTLVIEDGQIALVPVVDIDVLGSNGRSH